MIDLGIELTPEKVAALSQVQPIEAGTYEFVVDRIEPGNTQEGRPQWTAFLKVEGVEKYANRFLRYNMPLPYYNHGTGQLDVSGIGLLFQLTQGTGVTWVGDLKLNEVQEALRNALIGARGFMKVGLRKRKREDLGGEEVTENTVRIVTRR